jgi:hypothetical protein
MREKENPREASKRLRDGLVGLVDELQAAAPMNLLPCAHLVDVAVQVLSISGAAVRGYITVCVQNGSLIEIRPRRDWLVELPDTEELPNLYALLDQSTYQLTRQEPMSRGASNTSFIITPRGLDVLRVGLYEEFEVPVPEPGQPGAHNEKVPRTITHERYQRLVRGIGEACGLNQQSARKAVAEVMGQLNLHLPD